MWLYTNGFTIIGLVSLCILYMHHFWSLYSFLCLQSFVSYVRYCVSSPAYDNNHVRHEWRWGRSTVGTRLNYFYNQQARIGFTESQFMMLHSADIKPLRFRLTTITDMLIYGCQFIDFNNYVGRSTQTRTNGISVESETGKPMVSCICSALI